MDGRPEITLWPIVIDPATPDPVAFSENMFLYSPAYTIVVEAMDRSGMGRGCMGVIATGQTDHFSQRTVPDRRA